MGPCSQRPRAIASQSSSPSHPALFLISPSSARSRSRSLSLSIFRSLFHSLALRQFFFARVCPRTPRYPTVSLPLASTSPSSFFSPIHTHACAFPLPPLFLSSLSPCFFVSLFLLSFSVSVRLCCGFALTVQMHVRFIPFLSQLPAATFTRLLRPATPLVTLSPVHHFALPPYPRSYP